MEQTRLLVSRDMPGHALDPLIRRASPMVREEGKTCCYFNKKSELWGFHTHAHQWESGETNLTSIDIPEPYGSDPITLVGILTTYYLGFNLVEVRVVM